MNVKARPLGKLGTFLQLILVIAALLGPDLARMEPGVTHGTLNALKWSVAVVAVGSCVDYVIVGVRMFFDGRRAATRDPQVVSDR